jgi:hypothetical protein
MDSFLREQFTRQQFGGVQNKEAEMNTAARAVRKHVPKIKFTHGKRPFPGEAKLPTSASTSTSSSTNQPISPSFNYISPVFMSHGAGKDAVVVSSYEDIPEYLRARLPISPSEILCIDVKYFLISFEL